jgi:hypothetical protein
MPAEVAALLRRTARERRSFLVMAVPRLAGKSTVKQAILDERPPGTPVRTIGVDGDDVDELVAGARDGYVDIPEIAEGPWGPGYIRGEPLRQILRAVGPNVSVAAALHAPDPESAFEFLTAEGVRAADIAKISLVVYLRSFGDWRAPTRRIVETVHSVEGLDRGRPKVRLAYRAR